MDHINQFNSAKSQDLDYQRHMQWAAIFVAFSQLRSAAIVRFVDVGGIVDHHCLNLKVRGGCLFC